MQEHTDIMPIAIEREMKKSYLDYAMSVIVARALPDVRDGLKPVHRRILWGMNELGLAPDKPYRKSARLVGDVLGKYHPHGDTAIYDAAVRLAQDFNTRYPLIDGQGNYGSIDGDGAAAMRYTELRMTKLTQEMLRDINKETVDFQPNFDEREQEPTVLPARFPNLLVNGSSGIAVGMATNMAPHNLNETIDGCIAFIDNPDITVQDLMKFIKGPDFPTGAHIMGKQGIIDAYETGRGRVIMRAVANIEEHKGRYSIIVTEIPYQVNKSRLIEKMAELVKEKRIDGISDLRDESSREGIRIVIEVKRDANPNILLNNLYKYTQMQQTFGIINLALVDGEPRVLSLPQLIAHYIDHQVEVVTRRTRFDLKRAEARAHIIEGLLIAIDNIDEVIQIIRAAKDDKEASEQLIARFQLTEEQTKAILDMRLRRLTGLEKGKLEAEYRELTEQIAYYRSLLADEDKLLGVIKEELEEIKRVHGDKRRTKIKPAAHEIDIEELIEKEDVLITLTKDGYIKRTPTSAYKLQHRGGKGILGISSRTDDFVETLFVASTHDDLVLFTNKGKVYKMKAYEIPEGKRTARGQNIVNLLSLMPGEEVSAAFRIEEKLDKDSFLIFSTRKGILKKSKLELYQTIRQKGLIAIRLDDKDELISVRVCQKEDQIILVSKNGYSILTSVDGVRAMGRNARGVRGMNLGRGDEVVSMDIVEDHRTLLIVSELGYGKRTPISQYTEQKRGGKGVYTYKVTEKTGPVVSAKIVQANDEIMMISVSGDVIRISAGSISSMGKRTSGVKLKDMQDENDRIAAVAKYVEDVDEL
ncbi:MAG: DNA gyrase subunit A [Tissierellia bacterium]|jgi:DNA gyrase subunit A|nr:DNA gyrase subunit A [Bacillota bacterium]NLK59033.1 DNA gyrase subunit A [Tissierellia bacterium]